MFSVSRFLPKSAKTKGKVISVDSQTQPKLMPLNICMRLYEIDGRYKAFEVSVSVLGIGNFRTLIHAEAAADAQRAAEYLYGRKRISTVRRVVPETQQPKTPEQQRIQRLNQQAKQYRAMAQQEKGKLAMKRAQKAKTPTIKPLRKIKPTSSG